MQREKERDSTAASAEERETLPQNPAEGETSEDFEFAFYVSDSPTVTADEIFSNGQIRPLYNPVFNGDAAAVADKSESEKKAEENSKSKSIRLSLRRLMNEDRESCSRSASISSASSSSSSAELDGIAPETYCLWEPRSAARSQDRCEKSRSAGSSMRWRLRDLVVGRSHSAGTEKFVFLAAEKPKAEAAEGRKGSGKGKGGKVTEMDIVTAHRLYYGGGGGQVVKGGRRSFLPYKQDLVGFFAGGNDISRSHDSHHPI